MSTIEAWIVGLVACAALIALLWRLAAAAACVPIPGLLPLFAGNEGPFRLHRLAEMQGLAGLDARSIALVRDGAIAARRCMSCRVAAECDKLLAARDVARLRAICPNSGYFDRLAAR